MVTVGWPLGAGMPGAEVTALTGTALCSPQDLRGFQIPGQLLCRL